MRQQDRERILDNIRAAVLEQRYVMTPHALLEMRDDKMDLVDVESAILTGRIERAFENDPRGTRFEVVGTATDLATRVGVVVRLTNGVLIITIYELKR